MTTARIEHIETAAVRLVGPSLLVRVWSGDVCGIGECYPSGPVAAIRSIVCSLGEILRGQDPRDVTRLYETMRRQNLFTGAQAGAVVTAMSGIEMALWDLAGKLMKVPVHRLLGGPFRDRVRLYADCHAGTVDAAGHHLGGTNLDPRTESGRAQLAGAVDAARSRGFTAFKFDVDDVHGPLQEDFWNGHLTNTQISRMVAQVGAIREAVGDADLAIDMHARYDLPSAVRAARALEPFDLIWLEEPVPPENLHALAEVRRRSPVPICAGENLYTRFPFRDLLAAGAVDTVMPDLAKCGGLSEGRRIADLAELHYIPFAPHNVSGPIGTVAAAHLCATLPNFTMLEFHALDVGHFESLVRYAEGPVVQDGYVRIGEAPGLGLELDEDVAFAHRHVKAGGPFFGREVQDDSMERG
jgi:galactonate dehydratase